MNSIIGRKKEIRQLDKVMASGKSEFVALSVIRYRGKVSNLPMAHKWIC